MPRSCDALHVASPLGCAPVEALLRYQGGTLHVGPSDWEAQGISSRSSVVAPFALDRFELTREDARRVLDPATPVGAAPLEDPYAAAVLTLEQAKQVCRARGGRLPRAEEWQFAAMGASEHRYPWGGTGAVCARAAFGLLEGPCAMGARGPDTVGAHPEGASPEGALDLAGNVAEWVLTHDGNPWLAGGSFRSRFAAELRGWALQEPSSTAPMDAGARCAHDLPP